MGEQKEEIQELDRSIGGTKVVDEQKGPTIWHVLGVGTLIGALTRLVLLIFFGIFIGTDLSWGDYLSGLPLHILPSMIGAAVGVFAPREIPNKWKGLWIGAVLGLVIFFGALIIYFWYILSNTP